MGLTSLPPTWTMSTNILFFFFEVTPNKTTNINDHKISSDEGESIYFTRSVRRMLDANSTLSFENQVDNHLKKFATNLYKHLTEVFTSKDKSVIETSRTVTDWISLAIQLKSKSVSVLFLLEKVKFVDSCLKIDRNLRKYKDLEISNIPIVLNTIKRSHRELYKRKT